MARVYLQPQLRDLTMGAAEVEVGGTTLREVIAELDRAYPGLARRLVYGDGLSPGIAASIDGTVTARGLLAAVAADSEIHFLPAIGGG
ncbi:MAG: molybdopterin synthase sulfur carrier subunit [Planctomycetota bacterium]|nr:MAG: molybdopterin synthase sulfur carrier subunit [Planctomycetota bacterium]